MYVEVKVINAFSIGQSGGNPAGLVIGADAFTAQQKQLIASKAGLSETAFLSNSLVADYRLEFFTPTRQIPHCGHATIAAFSYLKSSGVITADVSSKETVDGTREILFEGNTAYMHQSPVEFSTVSNQQEIVASLGLKGERLHEHLPVIVGNTGNPYLLVPLRSEADLKYAQPDLAAIRRISEELNCTGFYVFAQTTGTFDAQARMFAPVFGIDEESATGMGAGPLGGYLYKYSRNRKPTYIIGQGNYMPVPSASRITVHIDPGSGTIIAGGDAYVVKTIGVEV